MRLSFVRSGNNTRVYIIRSTYDPKTRKTSSKIVEKLGTLEEICKREGVEDAKVWAKSYLDKLNLEEKSRDKTILIPLNCSHVIEKDIKRKFHAGSLFIDKICTELKLDSILEGIGLEENFNFDLAQITYNLISSRIIDPSSKRSSYEVCSKYLGEQTYALHDVYRALTVLANHFHELQASLYKNSLVYGKRNTSVLYYDCTNFFFEIETEDENGCRQFGNSKENRPNPIVEMGLFMDGDGLPLAMCIEPGNRNEQITMQPLEKKILSDFSLSRFITCTDAGLSSKSNKRFNTFGERAYITTQSIKKLPDYLKRWALSADGWRIGKSEKTYNIKECRKAGYATYYDTVFYKERNIKGDEKDALEEKLIVTFSFKYEAYQRRIRTRQIERAQKKIDAGPGAVERKRQNDPNRFIKSTAYTPAGEVAEKTHVSLGNERITEEERYDGFYCVSTSLVDEDDISTILKVNRGRWQIEECFRILKSEFNARPVYLQRDERIYAHFLICFMALLVYRILEIKLDGRFTCTQIVDTLRDMDVVRIGEEGYIPAYTRTAITDAIHKVSGFRTDYEIMTNKMMYSIKTKSRSRKIFTKWK